MTLTGNRALQFELVVGMEIHVQLNTSSKIFSADSTEFGKKPNSNVSAVSMALPGALPFLNKAVIEKAIRMGLALNCRINQVNSFERKNYFYADLPKGYQITQDKQPICVNGSLTVTSADGSRRVIRINRIHLEEDAGKSLHDQSEDHSFVDLNRAGVPLIEIVTEPDIRTAEEAAALLTEIRKIVRHLDVGDGNMEEGSLRCDANISVRKQETSELGTRCEVKNLNSIRNLRRAIAFEYQRQADVLLAGGDIVQSTLNFDAATGITSPMRSKEEANDYRYFPDPDLPPVFVSDDWLKKIKAGMPKLPHQLAADLADETGISRTEAELIIGDPALFNYYQAASRSVDKIKSLVNWLLGPIRGLLAERELLISEFRLTPLQLAKVINLVDLRLVSQQAALQQLIPALEKSQEKDPQTLAKAMGIMIGEQTESLERHVEAALIKFKAQAEAYKNGKKGVLGLFVGEVMKQAGGKADPRAVNELIIEKLKK